MPQDFNCQMNLANRAEMREQNGSQLPNGKSNSFHNHIQLNCQLSQLIFPLLLLVVLYGFVCNLLNSQSIFGPFHDLLESGTFMPLSPVRG